MLSIEHYNPIDMDINTAIYLKLNAPLGKNKWLDAFGRAGAEWVIFGLAAWFVVTVFLAFAPDYRKCILVMGFTAIPALVGWVLNFLFAFLVREPRPYIALGQDHSMFHPYIPSLHRWKSFPSDHAMWSFTICFMALVWHLPMAWPLFILALWIGWSRVFAGVHYPSDIFGGFAVAAFTGSVMNLFIN